MKVLLGRYNYYMDSDFNTENVPTSQEPKFNCSYFSNILLNEAIYCQVTVFTTVVDDGAVMVITAGEAELLHSGSISGKTFLPFY